MLKASQAPGFQIQNIYVLVASTQPLLLALGSLQLQETMKGGYLPWAPVYPLENLGPLQRCPQDGGF